MRKRGGVRNGDRIPSRPWPMEAMEEEYLKALKAAAEKVSPNSVWIVSSPGINTGPVNRVAVPMTSHPTNLGNVNAWLVEAFGDEEARRLLSLRDEARVSVGRRYFRNRPDLSYYPQ